MKNIIKKFPQTVAVLAAIAAIFLFFGSREGTVPPSQKSSSAGGTDLNGQWSLKFWPQPDTGALRTLGEAKNVQEAKTIKAQVPGNVELDLFRAGLVPNPELGDNSYKLREYEGYQWLFSREFASPKLESGERAILRLDGIDTFADIFVNGKKVGETSNMLIPHSFDITDFLSKNGKNNLEILIRSAIMESNGRKIGAISSAYDSEGIRKAPHMYGWDIMPRMLSAGIWRDAKIEIQKPARIEDIFFMTVYTDPKNNEAVCSARIRTALPRELLGKLSVLAKLSIGGETPFRRGTLK